MPARVGIEKEVIHEGFLSEQKYGKFAKRWVVLEKCKGDGCLFLSVYRYSEDETNPVAENFKHHYILSEYEFIGTIKGKLGSNRNPSFYWAIILKSEILQFQNKSLFVCEKWNSMIRENISYITWEVRTSLGSKSTSQETILNLTDYLFALCYSDLSKVLCVTRLEDILLCYSDGCRVSFRTTENGETSIYEVETTRRSQAARIVEEVQARKQMRQENQDTDRDLSNSQPAQPVRSRKESFQPDENFASAFSLCQTGRPLVTPPPTPESVSPYTGLSPSGSPSPSPLTRRRTVETSSSTRSQSLLPDEGESVENKLKGSGGSKLQRKNALRRRRGKTAPNIMLSSSEEKSSDGKPQAVPKRPARTPRSQSQLISLDHSVLDSSPVRPSLSLSRAPLLRIESTGCAVCVDVCSCEIRGPVLPLPIKRPQENHSDASSLSSENCSNEGAPRDISEEYTTTPSSSNRSSLEVVPTPSSSPQIDQAMGFPPEDFPSSVAEHGVVGQRKIDCDVKSKPRIPERTESLYKAVKVLSEQQKSSKSNTIAEKDCGSTTQRKFSRDESISQVAQIHPVVPSWTVSLSNTHRTCFVCNGPCECDQRELSPQSFVNCKAVEEESPYAIMGGNGGPYLSTEEDTDLHFSSTQLTSKNEVENPSGGTSIDELDSQERPIPKPRTNMQANTDSQT